MPVVPVPVPRDAPVVDDPVAPALPEADVVPEDVVAAEVVPFAVTPVVACPLVAVVVAADAPIVLEPVPVPDDVVTPAVAGPPPFAAAAAEPMVGALMPSDPFAAVVAEPVAEAFAPLVPLDTLAASFAAALAFVEADPDPDTAARATDANARAPATPRAASQMYRDLFMSTRIVGVSFSHFW